MTMKRLRPSHALSLCLSISFLLTSCAKSNNALVESAPAYQPSPATAQIKLPNVIAPKIVEVQEVVRRVFKDNAILDSSSKPNFFVGDFNGDSSQDLAVVVKPAPGKLAEMNEEYPSWLLRDPFLTNRNQQVTLTVEEKDTLLAIIHGFGNNDWRDPQATQTYLLKNAVGANMAVQTGTDFFKGHSGRKLPRPERGPDWRKVTWKRRLSLLLKCKLRLVRPKDV